jgi:hypothetical protein
MLLTPSVACTLLPIHAKHFTSVARGIWNWTLWSLVDMCEKAFSSCKVREHEKEEMYEVNPSQTDTLADSVGSVLNDIPCITQTHKHNLFANFCAWLWNMFSSRHEYKYKNMKTQKLNSQAYAINGSLHHTNKKFDDWDSSLIPDWKWSREG